MHVSPEFVNYVATWRSLDQLISKYLIFITNIASFSNDITPKESWKSLSILMQGLRNFSWGIPGHNHYNCGEPNCLYVCQSVSWLTSLLKLHKYSNISTSGRDMFLKFLEAFLGCLYTFSK